MKQDMLWLPGLSNSQIQYTKYQLSHAVRWADTQPWFRKKTDIYGPRINLPTAWQSLWAEESLNR